MSSTTIDVLAQGEAFTRIFVQPMVEAVRQEMQVHVADVKAALAKVDTFEGRIGKLESGQRKALVGYGVFATGLAGAMTAAWKYITAKVHIT